MKDDGTERQDKACEHSRQHEEGWQKCITEALVEQDPHDELFSAYIVLQENVDKPVSQLFLESISKGIEKTAWKAFWGPALEDPRLARTVPHRMTDIQCFSVGILSERQHAGVRMPSPPFRTERRRERDRVYRKLADIEDAIDTRGHPPTAEEVTEMTLLKRRMDALASGTAEDEPLRSNLVPEPDSHWNPRSITGQYSGAYPINAANSPPSVQSSTSPTNQLSLLSDTQPSTTLNTQSSAPDSALSSTQPSLQSSTTTNTQTRSIESAQTSTTLSTRANSSLDTLSVEKPNKTKKWSSLSLLKFIKRLVVKPEMMSLPSV